MRRYPDHYNSHRDNRQEEQPPSWRALKNNRKEDEIKVHGIDRWREECKWKGEWTDDKYKGDQKGRTSSNKEGRRENGQKKMSFRVPPIEQYETLQERAMSRLVLTGVSYTRARRYSNLQT